MRAIAWSIGDSREGPLHGAGASRIHESGMTAQSLIADHYAVQRACYFTAVEEMEDAIVAASIHTDDFIWNHAYFRDTPSTERLEQGAQWLGEFNRDLTVYLDASRAAMAGGSLGMRPIDHETWMLRSTADASSDHVHLMDAPDLAVFAQLVGAMFRPDYANALIVSTHHAVRGRHLILFVNGDAIGTASLYWRSNAFAAIHDVGILPAWRGRGLGQNLVHAVVQKASESGVAACYLQCEAKAERFYYKLGFRCVHRRVGFQMRPSGSAAACGA